MKAPPEISEVTLTNEQSGIYPPQGFLPFCENQIGNGDYFGLYWPYGREAQEPFVAEMFHDCWGMGIAFASLAKFMKWSRAQVFHNDLESEDLLEDDEIEWIELDETERMEDPALPSHRFAQAKILINQDPENALEILRGVCGDFPEHAEYWYCLAGQLKRTGDKVGSIRAAIRSFASNWSFALPPNGVLHMLKAGEELVEFANDPLIQNSGKLTLKYGGTKENTNYEILQACIRHYLQSEEPLLGLLLNQNYGYLMSGETVSFKERHGFNEPEWVENHIRLCEMHLGDPRTGLNAGGLLGATLAS